ncbi:translation elongation factor Ts [bacterium]|nr:translation elongation factor Ts [bacterium]
MTASASDVKRLRDKTGAGMMDCKKALIESGGDLEKAIDTLRKKGIASAQKRMGKEAKEGVILSYIHPGNRLGVLLELNCETDFVAKTDDFLRLAKDIAMQIAASNPLTVSREQIPQEKVDKELEIYRTQARNEKKPEPVVEKVAQGRLDKFFQEYVLMEQNFIKDTSKTVKDFLLEAAGRLGENIAVRRFVRFQLGEEVA